MKKIVIIGGGLAGISAATQLASQNHSVTLIEASPSLGGRARAFYDKATDQYLDNGQHILMGCYHNTFRFLELIGAKDTYTYQKALCVNYLDKHRKHHRLAAKTTLHPVNLLAGILNFTAIPIKERLRALTFAAKMLHTEPKLYRNITVADLYELLKQPNGTIEALWDAIGVGALNTASDKASAMMLVTILKEIFFTGNFSSTIVLPPAPITDGFVPQTNQYLKKHNASILTSEKITEIRAEKTKITEIRTSKNIHADFDYVIFAIPSYGLQKIEGIDAILPSPLPEYTYSSILTGHFFLKHNPLTEPFYALIGSPAQWVFNHNEHITTVTSDANAYISKSKEDLSALLINELTKYIPIKKEHISSSRIVKEKRATIESTAENMAKRLNTKTPSQNAFLAGDWTDTGLPATIEGAIKSGFTAANEVFGKINN